MLRLTKAEPEGSISPHSLSSKISAATSRASPCRDQSLHRTGAAPRPGSFAARPPPAAEAAPPRAERPPAHLPQDCGRQSRGSALEGRPADPRPGRRAGPGPPRAPEPGHGWPHAPLRDPESRALHPCRSPVGPSRRPRPHRRAPRAGTSETRATWTPRKAARPWDDPSAATLRPPEPRPASRSSCRYFSAPPRMSGRPFLGLPTTTTFALLLIASFSVASMPFHSRIWGLSPCATMR